MFKDFVVLWSNVFVSFFKNRIRKFSSFEDVNKEELIVKYD